MMDIDQVRREILLGGRGRRACSEQGPGGGVIPMSHLWSHGKQKHPWTKKRTSAPQMSTGNRQLSANTRTALVLRSRRSWPVAPTQIHR
ncbi:hypothetical protein B566_EDAN009005 [Ephemera danica]|nr:hypothetical protein B566_EDAN009005 [Ephemera danica]